jgi:thiopeptide-type bacteriocin biosynthesis protein
MFKAIDAALIRAAACDAAVPPWPDLTSRDPDLAGSWQTWLRAVWDNDPVAEAIELASPALAAGVQDVIDDRVRDPKRIRRAAESVARYLLRMTSRATPFGLFAGVAPVAFGDHAATSWSGAHQAFARPSGTWLDALIRQLEAQPGILAALTVTANNLAFVRGDRLVLPSVPCTSNAGHDDPSDVTIRNTAAADAMAASRSPITVSDLADEIAAFRPGTPRKTVTTMLGELTARRFLLSCLHPPADVTDPLGYLIGQLAGTSGAADAVAARLRVISNELARLPAAPPGTARRSLRLSAAQLMSRMCELPGAPIDIDLRLGCSVVLPPTVIREAEAAASVLVRLAPATAGNLAWRAWHGRFLDRYGPGAVIPVTEVVNDGTGLGYPAGYRGSLERPPTSSFSPRDQYLLHLAQQTALDGTDEVILDEAAIAALTAGTTPAPHTCPHTELRFSVQATSAEALDRGDFILAVVSAARQAGTSSGRFAYLLDTGHQRAFTGLPTLTDGSITAQVSCLPLSARTSNLARAPAVLPLISLGEYPTASGQHIPLEDLAVTCDASRPYLVSMSQGRVVEAIVFNAMEFRYATHPLARFLSEISTSTAAHCLPFSWGAAASLPFLPRLRYRRTIVQPARWNLTAADLPGRNASWPDWDDAFTATRAAYRISTAVYLGDHDVLNRLDLDEPVHRAVLRTHLNRAGTASLSQAPDDQAHAWIGGRPHEIVLPLATPAPTVCEPPTVRARLMPPTSHPGHVPGISTWLYAQLLSHPDRHSEILTRHLPDLIADWPEPPQWWFLRYHDPSPHLRLRIKLDSPADYGQAATRIGAWADRLRRAGLLTSLSLGTYHPEVGRYGTGPVMESAETVFAADSAAAAAQLGTAIPPPALTAASFIDMAAAFTGSHDDAMRWLSQRIPRSTGTAVSRDDLDTTTRLASPDGGPALHAAPGGDQVRTAWDRRAVAVTAYRAQLEAAGGPDPDLILLSLLHMHHARVIGTGIDSERACLRLARNTAVSATRPRSVR